MPTFLAKLLTWFLDLLRGKTPAASRIEVVSREAAQAETTITQERATDVAIDAALAARDRADAERLRAPDPEVLARSPNRYARD